MVLSESTWDHQAVNQQRIQLLCEDPATAPHAQGVLVIDDTRDRKAGRHTAHVARQYLGVGSCRSVSSALPSNRACGVGRAEARHRP
jgi:SRSO17 transposase